MVLMKKVIILFFFLCQFAICQAQEDDLRQILRVVFYHPEIFDKIFFQYSGTDITFLEGYKSGMKGAFVLPDTTLQSKFPNLLEIIGVSHSTEKYFLTITFLANRNGNTYITAHVMDPAISLYIDLDCIIIQKRKASVSFHTTSFSEISIMKERYIVVESELRKRRSGWRIGKMQISPIKCCTNLW